jgi:hypothetical protein
MRDQSNQEHPPDGYAERLVLLAVLARRGGYPRVRLPADLEGIDPELLERAITSLEASGLLCATRTRLRCSAALKRLDELNMICV